MSDRQQLAEQATQLGLAGLAIGSATLSATLSPVLVPVAVLAALGVDLQGKKEKRAVKKAIGSALTTLASYPDLTDQDIATANHLLRDSKSRLMIDPRKLAIASSRQDLAELMIRPLLDNSSSISRDSAVATVLKLVMGAVFETLRQMDPFRQALSDEQLRHLVGQSDVIEDHLKGIKQSVNKTRDDVEELLKAVSENRQPPFAPMPESSKINHYAARRFGVLGRDGEQRTLRRFLKGGVGFQWLQIAGVGGQGKSRMALDLVRDAQDSGWIAGYMERGDLEEFVDEWHNWLPDEPTVIVVDYLIGLEELLAPLLKKLSRRNQELTVAVRVLLIERQRWDRGGLRATQSGRQKTCGFEVSKSEGRAEWFQKIAERHDGDDVLLAKTRFDGGVLELERLSPDELVRLVRQVAQADGKTIDYDDETLAGHLARIDESGRPLYAYFLGQALGEGSDVGFWTKHELLDDVLRREHSRRWKKALSGGPPAIGDDLPSVRLALLATMVGPIDCRHLASQIDWPQPDSQTRREALVLTDGALSEGISGPSQLVPTLQPDLLGEWFVLRAIEEGAQADVLMKDAWSLAPESLSAFLVRVAQDFPTHVSFDQLMKCEPAADEGQQALAEVASSILLSLWKAKRLSPESLMRSLQLAASLGDASAMNNLGICYEQGKGVDQDLGLAVHWYWKGAEAGNSLAMTNLGLCYWEGQGVGQNLSLAVYWYRIGAELGNGYAMSNLGVCYEQGKGVEQDWDLAVYWFRKGAEAGDSYGMSNLGYYYSNSESVNQNLGMAVRWYRKGAEAGDASAMSNLGVCYEQGVGVVQDLRLAVEWYRKGAEAGDGYAMNNLGVCYERGKGVGQDCELANSWYRKGAEAGYGGAMINLAYCYANGKGVAQENWELAKNWYRKGAEKGNDHAK